MIDDLGVPAGGDSCNPTPAVPGGATIAVYGAEQSHSILIVSKAGLNHEFITGTQEKMGVGPAYAHDYPESIQLRALSGTYAYYKEIETEEPEPPTKR